MKKVILVTLALGVVCAQVPSAQADSFGSKTSDSKFTSAVLVEGSGVSSNRTDMSRALKADNAPLNTFSSINSEVFTSGLDVRGQVASSTSGSLLDNLAYLRDSGSGIRGASGVLVDFSGNEMNLVFGSLKASSSVRSPFSNHGGLAGKSNSLLSSEISKGRSNLVAGAATLTATPEPGSLFLLGTGLLFMALALFWKAAKQRPTPGS